MRLFALAFASVPKLAPDPATPVPEAKGVEKAGTEPNVGVEMPKPEDAAEKEARGDDWAGAAIVAGVEKREVAGVVGAKGVEKRDKPLPLDADMEERGMAGAVDDANGGDDDDGAAKDPLT